MSEPAPTDAALSARIASGLGAELRAVGLSVTVFSLIEFARALLCLGELQRTGLYWAARASFVRAPEEIAAFDAAFAAYLDGAHGRAGIEMPVPSVVPAGVEDADEHDEGGDAAEGEGMRFSSTERLASADLGTLSDAEAEEVRALIAALSAEPALVRSRRLSRATRTSERLDVRRTVAGLLRTDRELILRRYRARRNRPRRIVVLCDVSGSMEPYARAMLHFAHVVVRATSRTEVFAMGTRLTRLTRRLAVHDPDSALAGAAEEILDWSGGTRVGETLHEFNDRFGVRGLARAATVLICSDGIDRGEPELVSSEMARLARIAHRIVWVNPLKSTPGYEPLARGMAAALPYVDEFVPGGTFAALEKLAREIAR